MRTALVPAAIALVLAAAPARAEIVVFQTGRTVSVKSYRTDGADLVLTLRTGGEMTCPASLVAAVLPDEVPYPEPSAVTEPAGDDAEGEAEPQVSVPPLRVDARYDPLIQKVAREQGVDVGLVRAVIQVESAYQPRARSPKGAVGLMQLLPSTARQYGVRNPYDPVANIEAGIKHLKALLDRFPLKLALAAYNAGEAAVERFGGMPPYPETRSYVARILALIGG